MNRKFTAIILAAAMTLTGTNIAPFVAADSYAAQSAETLSGVLPQSYDEAAAFSEKYGTVSVHDGYIVYCDIENHSTPTGLFLDQYGNSKVKEIENHSYTKETPSPPGSPCYVVRVYEAQTWGVLECNWYQRNQFDEDAPKMNEVRKYFSVGDDLKIAEIDEIEYTFQSIFKDAFVWDTKGSNVEFTNTAHNAELQFLVASNLDYDIKYDGRKATFTPKQDGRYVLTLAEVYREDVTIDGVEAQYVYPVLSNFTVDFINGHTICEKYGSCSRYSEDDLTAENMDDWNVINSDSCDLMGGDGTYYAFVNRFMETYGDDLKKAYISDWWTVNGIQGSYFCVLDQHDGKQLQTKSFEEEIAKFDGIKTTSSSNEGDLSAPSPDMIDQYRFKALSDGIVTMSVGEYSYDLAVKNRRFVRITDLPEVPESIVEILPRTVSRFSEFKAEYGSASVKGGFIVYCGDVAFCDGMDLELRQDGDGKLTPVMEYCIDPEGDKYSSPSHVVIVYAATEPGKVKAEWVQINEWDKSEVVNDVKYFDIDSKLNINEITAAEFGGGMRGDVNGDGQFSISDVLTVSRWILGEKVEIACWENADLCKDGKIDVYDYCMLKKEVLEKK